ncbi:DUF2889 domain-containing protein [Noviherbaspirillum saxi]|uniref:DUF2889 domain-containing protein n=1 Tax=Noviherbaspirillum saxi TaxID=2320863 RepID=A0A3A3FQP0_9BURK|nr:DUF2889 domain-containing protein [Noviherbaspirillum saxi]RJF98532.1 DUF2889 domain-containing protein [Noviherbaspirillum saxi]
MSNHSSVPAPSAPVFAHRRTIDCQSARREDGLWELQATLHDFKGTPFPTATGGKVMPGEALHHMQLTLVFNDALTIQTAQTRLFSGPAPDCHHVDTSYDALIGMTLGPGFSRQAQERFGGIRGCTHMNELLPIATTVAIQTVLAKRMEGGTAVLKAYAPAFVNQCYTWRSDGPAIQSINNATYKDV